MFSLMNISVVFILILICVVLSNIQTKYIVYLHKAFENPALMFNCLHSYATTNTFTFIFK